MRRRLMHPLRRHLVWALSVFVFLASATDAHVTRVEILSREGYTIARLGWQFDLAEEGQKVRLSAPVARDAGGKEIRGLVRSDFTPSQKVDDMPLGHIMLGPSGGKS